MVMNHMISNHTISQTIPYLSSNCRCHTLQLFMCVLSFKRGHCPIVEPAVWLGHGRLIGVKRRKNNKGNSWQTCFITLSMQPWILSIAPTAPITLLSSSNTVNSCVVLSNTNHLISVIKYAFENDSSTIVFTVRVFVLSNYVTSYNIAHMCRSWKPLFMVATYSFVGFYSSEIYPTWCKFPELRKGHGVARLTMAHRDLSRGICSYVLSKMTVSESNGMGKECFNSTECTNDTLCVFLAISPNMGQEWLAVGPYWFLVESRKGEINKNRDADAHV